MRVLYSLFFFLLAALYPHTAPAAEPRPRVGAAARPVRTECSLRPAIPRRACASSLYQGQERPGHDLFRGLGHRPLQRRRDTMPSLREYFREKYKDRKIGVIVAHGSAALELLLRLRDESVAAVPVVFALVDELRLAKLKLPPDVTGRTVRLKFEHVVADGADDGARAQADRAGRRQAGGSAVLRTFRAGDSRLQGPVRIHRSDGLAAGRSQVARVAAFPITLRSIIRRFTGARTAAATYHARRTSLHRRSRQSADCQFVPNRISDLEAPEA